MDVCRRNINADFCTFKPNFVHQCLLWQRADVKVKPALLAHAFGPCFFQKADALNYGFMTQEKMQEEKVRFLSVWSYVLFSMLQHTLAEFQIMSPVLWQDWILASKAIVTMMIEQCDKVILNIIYFSAPARFPFPPPSSSC